MSINFTDEFKNDLNQTLIFIGRDSFVAKENFKKGVFKQIQRIKSFPRQFRESADFNDPDFREIIYKGYVILFQINANNHYTILRLTKHRLVFSLK